MLQTCPALAAREGAAGPGTPEQRVRGCSPMAQGSPRCPSRVAPAKETLEPGSALKSGRSFYFIYVQLASAGAAKSLGPVPGQAGTGAGAHPAPTQHRPFCTKPSAKELPQPWALRSPSTGDWRRAAACGCWRGSGCPSPPRLRKAEPSAPSLRPKPAQCQGGILGGLGARGMSAPAPAETCWLSMVSPGEVRCCMAPGTAWMRRRRRRRRWRVEPARLQMGL